MSRTDLFAAIELACITGASYKLDVLGKYVQASYGLDQADVKSAILAMLHSGTLELTDKFEVTKNKRGNPSGQTI